MLGFHCVVSIISLILCGFDAGFTLCGFHSEFDFV